jgi:hypothetical protein
MTDDETDAYQREIEWSKQEIARTNGALEQHLRKAWASKRVSASEVA